MTKKSYRHLIAILSVVFVFVIIDSVLEKILKPYGTLGVLLGAIMIGVCVVIIFTIFKKEFVELFAPKKTK